MKDKFIPIKELVRYYSTWVLGLIAILATIDATDTGLQLIITAWLPEEYRAKAVAIVALIGILARAIKQNNIGNKHGN